MANVNWIKGETAPPEDGEYYVILEAQRETRDPVDGEVLVRLGEIEVTGDWYDAEDGAFESIGKDNPVWKVLAWAEIFKPSVPEELRDRVRWYFGAVVFWEGDQP